MGGYTGCSVSWYKGAACECGRPITRNRGFTTTSKHCTTYGFQKVFWGRFKGLGLCVNGGHTGDRFDDTKVRGLEGFGQLQEIEVLPDIKNSGLRWAGRSFGDSESLSSSLIF